MDLGRMGRGRWALAVLLGCFALLAAAPTALATSGTAQITGTVTKAGGVEVIEGIEVCAYEVSSELEGEFVEHCAQTNASGVYTISGLPAGEYDVEFFVPAKSSLNYVTQYYKEKSSFPESQVVPVASGAIVSGIDAALIPAGEIKGTVTEAASPHGGLQGVEVTVYEASGKEFPVGFATTEANGEYTVKGLAGGPYKLEFTPSTKSGLNYVIQYYENKPSLQAAQSIKVEQEHATTANAALEVGAEVSGTVTDAATHAALSNAQVVALGAGEIVEGRALTNVSGEYTIVGLASGIYKIGFASAHYIVQYFSNQPSFASANPVTASQGGMTPAVNAALVAKRPVNMAGPVAMGTPAVGKTLSCSTGSWTGSPTLSYTYAWLRNGGAIGGAIASTYVVQTADRGTGLACRVTATNKYGSTVAVSNTLTVPAAPPPPRPVPVITLSSTKIVASGSSARVSIACASATCTGTIELTEQVVVRHRHHGKTTTRKKTVVLAKGSYSLTAGHGATILVRLTHTGKSALAKARRHRLSAKLLASVTGGLTLRESVVLSELVHKHHRR